MGTPNSLFDIYLGDIASLQGYRCRSLSRESAPLVASKFSTGSAGQSDLDLLKSASVDSLAGGMFQRTHIDPTMAARVIGIYNRYDENVYPTLPKSSAMTPAISSGYTLCAKAESGAGSFMAFGSFSAGTYYNILMYTQYGGSGFASITLPAALQFNGFCNITGLTIHKNYLYVASQTAASGTNVDMWRYSIAAGTWQNITASGSLFFTLRGVLYVMNIKSEIYTVTNETAAGAATYTKITDCGSYNINAIATYAREFNGAGWITKPDGLYRFDGVTCIKVLDIYTLWLQPFNGALYFIAGNYLHKFDGTNVTKLQWFGRKEPVTQFGLTANQDFLFVQTASLTGAYQGGDKSITGPGVRRIYTYDGAAWGMLYEEQMTLGASYTGGLVMHGAGYGQYLYDIQHDYQFGWSSVYYQYNTSQFVDNTYMTTNSRIDITSSEFDDGFPSVFKSLEAIEVMYSGLLASDTIVVTYQTYDGKTWSAWQSAGTITATSPNYIELTDATKKLFKRMKVNAVLIPGAANTTASIKGLGWRYTLQPRPRWRWQTMLTTTGKDKAGNKITTDSNAISNNLFKAYKQKTPIFMLQPDYGLLKAQVSAVALSFVVLGQPAIYKDPYNEYPLCAVKNQAGVWEVLRVSDVSYNVGTDETTITVLERGYYGVTAGILAANAEFHPAHKVMVTRLLRDAPVLDENTIDQQDTTGESQIKREVLLELTEV